MTLLSASNEDNMVLILPSQISFSLIKNELIKKNYQFKQEEVSCERLCIKKDALIERKSPYYNL